MEWLLKWPKLKWQQREQPQWEQQQRREQQEQQQECWPCCQLSYFISFVRVESLICSKLPVSLTGKWQLLQLLSFISVACLSLDPTLPWHPLIPPPLQFASCCCCCCRCTICSWNFELICLFVVEFDTWRNYSAQVRGRGGRGRKIICRWKFMQSQQVKETHTDTHINTYNECLLCGTWRQSKSN